MEERVSERASTTRYRYRIEHRFRAPVNWGCICCGWSRIRLHTMRIHKLHRSYSLYSTSQNNLRPNQHPTRMRYVACDIINQLLCAIKV
jgi:hypothetical protein